MKSMSIQRQIKTMMKLKIKISETDVEYEGNESFLRTDLPRLLDAIAKSHNVQVKKDLLNTLAQLWSILADMEDHFQNIYRSAAGFAQSANEFREIFAQSLSSLKKLSTIPADISTTITQMQGTFNVQYLMLQRKMEDESRQFSMVSNMMKTKHDTAENSINNIR